MSHNNSDCDSSTLPTGEHVQDLPVLQLLMNIEPIGEDIIFHNKGYKKIEKLCNTLQGALYKAAKTNQFDKKQIYVAIKKTNKRLLQKMVAVEGDLHFCVSENLIKEALVLKYVTFDNTPLGQYIAKYVDFFESATDYYLVTEYISSQMNLKQFIFKSRQYINNGLLSLKQYQRVVKCALFQLFATVQWLHNSMHCCHLDLCTENVMIVNAGFTEAVDGTISINQDISIKLCDLGVSEMFNPDFNCFLCSKQGLSLENEGWFAPKVFNGDIYDARCADNWSLGIILAECMMIGERLYEPMEIYQPNSGYQAIHVGKLKEYLIINNKTKYFRTDSFSLLNSLLNINEAQRIKGMDILRHKWFVKYFRKYKMQIINKFAETTQPFSYILKY